MYPEVKTKEIYYGNNQKMTRNTIRIKKSDFKAKVAGDIDNINDAFAKNSVNGCGFFVPRCGKYTMKYVAQVLAAEIPAFKNDEIEIISLPKIEEMSFELLKVELYRYADIMLFYPERYHRTGKFQGLKMIDDFVFSASIFNKVRPDEFKVWFDRQNLANKKRLYKVEDDTIEVDQEWWEKVTKDDKTVHRQGGKSGNMVVNSKKSSDLKRKREKIERVRVERQYQQDKVWTVNQDIFQNRDVPDGKEFVKARDFTAAVQDISTMQSNLLKLAEDAKLYPWFCVKHIENLEQREWQYNECRNNLLPTWTQYKVMIPTYAEASEKYRI